MVSERTLGISWYQREYLGYHGIRKSIKDITLSKRILRISWFQRELLGYHGIRENI